MGQGGMMPRPTPPATDAPAPGPTAPQDSRTAFVQAFGAEPANPGDLDALISGDTPARTAVLRSMPVQERLRAIQALKQLGHQ